MSTKTLIGTPDPDDPATRLVRAVRQVIESSVSPTYYDIVRSMTDDPTIHKAVDEAENWNSEKHGNRLAWEGRLKDLLTMRDHHEYDIQIINQELAEIREVLSMKEEKLYVSGPMQGYPEFNVPAFKAATLRLRGQGYTVHSPHEIAVEVRKAKDGSEEPTWHDYLRADIKVLVDCNAIVLLEGWAMSPGSKFELTVANRLDFHVYYLMKDPWNLIDMGRGRKIE